MSISIVDVQQGAGAISNSATYNNYRSVLNKISKHYGWEKDFVHTDLLQEHALELPGVIVQLWDVNNTEALKQKMSSISSMVTRALGTSDHRVKKVLNTIDKNFSIEAKTIPRNIPDWTELQPKLAEYGKEDSVRGVIALAFSHGYVLRVGEMFDTFVGGVDNMKSNYLDPDRLVWKIRMHKNSGSGSREFPVSKEFIDALPKKSGWLLHKKCGLGYPKPAARTLKYHGWWDDLPSNRDIRASFETWNMHSKGRTKDEVVKSHEVLGHTAQTSAKYYDKTLMKPVQSGSTKIRPNIKLRPV